MITYNHQRFIEQAVLSALQQETTFPVEILIAEDCSRDSTRTILEQLEGAYPDRLTLHCREKNMGMMANAMEVFRACRGEYIAFLEGDDYWTDPLKLQRQIEALESNPVFSGSFHPTVYVNKDGEPVGYTHPPTPRSSVCFKDLCYVNWPQTCSLVLRRTAVPDMPNWMAPLSMGDWPMCLLATLSGPLHMLEEPMAHYWIHSDSVWSSRHWLRRTSDMLDAYLVLARNLPNDRTLSLLEGQGFQAKELVARLQVVESSLSYRIGRAVTFPFRAIYDSLSGRRMGIENGFAPTHINSLHE